MYDQQRGDLKVVHGHENGNIEILALFDGFLSFGGVLNDRTILSGPHKREISFLRVIGDRLISGDVGGVVAIWDLLSNSLISRTSHHFSRIVSVIKVSDTRFVIIDGEGRVSLIDSTLKFIGFLGMRRVPLSSIRWTSEGDLLICLIFTDQRLQRWNTVSGNCEKECSSTIVGIDEVLEPFTNQQDLMDGGGTLLPNGTLPTLALSWRPQLANDPFKVGILDVRKLVENIRNAHDTQSDTFSTLQIKTILSFVVSLLLPWNYDPDIDSWAHRLGYAKRRRDVTLGIIGANGNVSFPSPSRATSWDLSCTMCASLYLALASLFEMSLDLGEDWDKLRMIFTSRLLERSSNARSQQLSNLLPLPSFSFASKYWHDLGGEIRHGSRLLIVQTLSRMSDSALDRSVEYWTELLPTNEQSDARKMNRSAIILGIIAVHRPEYLSEHIRKMVAESLMALLMDEKRNLFRSAAIELIGKAYPVWEGHVHALSVFRLLLGWLSGMSQIDESGPVAQLVVPFDNAATLDTLDSVRGTLLKLAAAAPQDILPFWLGQDFVAARTTVEKWTSISLLSDLIRQRPRTLRSFVHLVVETACRLVDGLMTGGNKTRLMSIAIPLVMDLTSAFPTVSYHRESYRLAVASPEEDLRITVYDLRSSGSPRMFEGHTKPLTALEFTPDGRHLVSYSWGEATLRWWQVPSGLIGLLGGVVKPIHTDIVDPSLTNLLQEKLPTFIEQDINEAIHFKWSFSTSGSGTLQIFLNDTAVTEVQIPVS